MKIASWFRSLSRRGYIGPRYEGLSGKLRLLAQGNLVHTEIVSYADAGWWTPSLRVPTGCKLVRLDTIDQATPYLATLSRAYSRDVSLDWHRYYSWGQVCAILTVRDQPAAFGWLQSGDKGAKCYYIQLQPAEFRAFREGVLPAFRGQGLYAIRHRLLLADLFARGASRVYIDSYEDNELSWKGHERAGYRRYGRVRVLCPLGLTQYVRWI